jgi:SP family general alpha glucoside:H+ symporter-like MFS transporter
MQSAVSYASEVCPTALRGYLTTYVNLCWVIGQFIGESRSSILLKLPADTTIAAGVLLGVQDRTDQWAYKIPFAIQWIWPVPLFILATFAPGTDHVSLFSCGMILIESESPWWLVRAGKLKEAEISLRRLSRKNDTADPAKTVAMMVRTNQHELENQPGVSYFDCFKGSDLRRTEIAVVGWAVQVLSGSSFGNQGTYFFQQGGSSSHSGVLTRSSHRLAGLNTADSFKFNLGMYALGFCGTCGSWITMTVCGDRSKSARADTAVLWTKKSILERVDCTLYFVSTYS